MFSIFVLNSGGQELPGVMVEIDFRPILGRNGKSFLKNCIFAYSLQFLYAFVIKNECFIP